MLTLLSAGRFLEEEAPKLVRSGMILNAIIIEAVTPEEKDVEANAFAGIF